MPITQFEDPTYLEAVYAAIFSLLQGAKFPTGVTINTFSRVSAWPDTFSPADQPALYLIEGPLLVEQKIVQGPPHWEFGALAIIVLRADSAASGQTPLPATLANYFIWGIAQAFNTMPPYQKQTLGGLVYHCFLDGEIHPEIQNEQMVIAFPIHILPGPSGIQ